MITTITDGNTNAIANKVGTVIVSRRKTKMVRNIVNIGLHETMGITVTTSPIINAWFKHKTAMANITPLIMNQNAPGLPKVRPRVLVFSDNFVDLEI